MTDIERTPEVLSAADDDTVEDLPTSMPMR
jgi:hypothetical protein